MKGVPIETVFLKGLKVRVKVKYTYINNCVYTVIYASVLNPNYRRGYTVMVQKTMY